MATGGSMVFSHSAAPRLCPASMAIRGSFRGPRISPQRCFSLRVLVPRVISCGLLLSPDQSPDLEGKAFQARKNGHQRLRRLGLKGGCPGGQYLHVHRSPAKKSSRSWTGECRGRLGGDGDVDLYGDNIAEDYYSVLGLTPDASPEEIKKAYYSCMKSCHPDLTGNTPSVTEFCKFVNEVYEVLSDPEQRMIYDEINGFTLTAVNPFRDSSAERAFTFVDEFTCIGCKNCALTDPTTFEIEETFGRARVMCQKGDPAMVTVAIETCPVDCIHSVTPAQLTLLEDEMRIVERVNVGIMLSGMGYQSPDVFAQASWKWEKRQTKAVERARSRLMKEKGKSGVDAWWNVQWGSDANEVRSKAATDKYARERAAKTAAAARRWREYSRQGVDRRAVRNLPSAYGSDVEEEEEPEKNKAGAKK